MSASVDILLGFEWNPFTMPQCTILLEPPIDSSQSMRLGEPEYTTWKLRPKGEIKRCIDYIFHSSSLLSSKGRWDDGFQLLVMPVSSGGMYVWKWLCLGSQVCHVVMLIVFCMLLCYLILLYFVQHLDFMIQDFFVYIYIYTLFFDLHFNGSTMVQRCLPLNCEKIGVDDSIWLSLYI